ncbi:hypothetical protein B296_00027233 [Ensete ventricosum]|uniref:Transposase (putative) gypsy type domain-containing protein n=1 Tax=Ensete ventricosum TaxID=4639 RepID=A0A426YBW3_ENSVE|nr:hypothetical protein B296_00027233 [Ensete ventricosum]
MKSCHDFDSIVSLESLATIRKRYSIPDEYILHVPGLGQRPYHPCPEGFSISIDALEAGLRFPLHPVIGECLRWWRVSPSRVAPNSWRYLITFLGESEGSGIVPTRDLFLSCFRLCKGQGSYYLIARAGLSVGVGIGVLGSNGHPTLVGRMLGLTSGVIASYGESIGAGAWHHGVAHNAAFMAGDNGSTGAASGRFHLGCRRGAGVGLSPTRMLTWPLSWC